jgi:hypothetical protein
MKLSELKQIIREEIQTVLLEAKKAKKKAKPDFLDMDKEKRKPVNNPAFLALSEAIKLFIIKDVFL